MTQITFDIHLNKPLPRNTIYKSEIIEALSIKWTADEYDISNVERQMRAFKRLTKELEEYWIPNHPNLCDIEIISDKKSLPSYTLKSQMVFLKKYGFELWLQNFFTGYSVVWVK